MNAADGPITEPRIRNHSFRATGITAYLKNGGTLEKARDLAHYADTRTTQLYDPTTADFQFREGRKLIFFTFVERLL